MFKIKYFKYDYILKKELFVSITSLQRIKTLILKLMQGEFKFWAVTDKKAKRREGNLEKTKNYRKPAELVRVMGLVSRGQKGLIKRSSG